MGRRLAAIAVAAALLGASGATRADRADLAAPDTFTVCIQPLGPYDPYLARTAKLGIEHLYGFSVRVLAPRKLPRFAYYKPRKRYRAEKLLDYLDEHVVPESGCNAVIGFTKKDISTTKGDTHDWGILGLATVGGPSGVVSSYRLRRRVKRRTLEMRTVKVVNHELGHVLGLEHYNAAGCVMNDAQGTVKTVDTETGLLCPQSRQRVEARHRIQLPVLDAFDWDAVLID